MSEDEFVVLLEHAGLTEVSDDGGQEFLEKHMLLEWLVREGIELFGAKFLLQHATSEDGSGGGGQGEEIENGDRDRDDDDDTTAAAAGAASELALSGSGTFMGDPRSKLALRILDRLVEREWLSPIEFDYDEDETEEWKATLFGIRLSTAEAYKIYIEKDSTLLQDVDLSKSGLSLRTQGLLADSESDTEQVAAINDPDGTTQQRTREKIWQDCFPTCSDSCKQMYFSFDSPEIILYSTLGLNLISNGISSVPAFSRELKNMGVSAEDRTVIVGFLARAFPCE